MLLLGSQMENRLLAALPDPTRTALIGRAERITLEQKAVLVERGAAVSELYFPLSGLLSIVVRVNDSAAVEVATAGNEGFVGAPAYLGAALSSTEVVVQIPGDALQVPLDALPGEAGPLLERYIAALMTQMSQSTACNYLHSVGQRLCRWLLATHDRVKGDELELTQEFLAQMLAVRRPTVSEVAGVLQEAGIIEYRRGRIRILDRARLEQGACECYGIVRAELDRVFAG
jgi:CRP-like cAMP-binding protein